ncbi:MltA-interacting protein precursor [Labrenzia sp. THAF82]|uniref:MipA/OmpV family protein n=1 Tax=Labrenzia sp. THAF82 TaxID=2587861 RepID=UPI00126845A1|nr:MipA/OmpV family protein [Labrenzia sp. THAF82]QFT33430.1 MltA-interacting protein precursor [Labrenzia sp. THAF82]
MRNRKELSLTTGLMLALTGCCAAPALAADLQADMPENVALEEDEQGGFHGIVVLGAGVQSDFEGAAEYAAVPLLYANLTAFGLGLEIEGPEASLNLRPDAAFQFGPSIGYDMGRDGTSNKVVDRLDKIDAAFEVGGFAAYQFSSLLAQSDVFEISAELMADVSGVHDGVSGSLGASYMYGVTERLRLGTEVAVGFASDSYMDTYFGVTSGGAARSGLQAYTAGGGVKDVSLGATASFNVTERWGIVGRVGYSRLLGDAADSPIVKKEGSADQFSGGIGISYSF